LRLVHAPPLTAAAQLKSLFCWRGHCDGICPVGCGHKGVEILVLLEGALRQELAPALGRGGDVEILVLLEGALRLAARAKPRPGGVEILVLLEGALRPNRGYQDSRSA